MPVLCRQQPQYSGGSTFKAIILAVVERVSSHRKAKMMRNLFLSDYESISKRFLSSSNFGPGAASDEATHLPTDTVVKDVGERKF